MWAIVPVKQLSECKTRLSARLGAAQRAELMLVMLGDVLRALGKVEAISGVGLLSSDEQVLKIAHERGLRTWPDRGGTVSECVETVAHELAAEGAAVMIVPADLPTATADDYRDLISRHTHGVTLVPSYDGGTNIVIADPGKLMPLSFGPDSLRIHSAAAEAGNIPLALQRLPAFVRDIDREADLDWLAASDSDCGARRWLLGQAGFVRSQDRRRLA